VPESAGILWIFGEVHLCLDKIDHLHQVARFDAGTVAVTASGSLNVRIAFQSATPSFKNIRFTQIISVA
jgi:hypothetical protein